MFLAMLLSSAQAGTLDLTLDADGHTTEVTLSGVAPCETARFERDERRGGPKVEMSARVEPLDDGTLLVAVGVERSTWEDSDLARLKLHPTLLVSDGEQGELTLTVDGVPATLTVTATDFAGAGCTGDRERTEVRSHRERRTRSSE
jgi:hypothetical protein